jgi:glycosyltransferase involved in cell wall biosynthesis
MSEKIGYPIKWTMGKANTVNPQDGSTLFESTAATPDIESIVRRMYQIYSNYDRALAKGRKAAEHMRKGFTWDISAQSLIRIIQKYTSKEKVAV